MIVADGNKSVCGQKCHEFIIAVDVLCNTMGYLYYGLDFTLRNTHPCVYCVVSGGGFKAEILKISH